MATEARFWAKVRKTPTCWCWTGARTSKGYGHLKIEGRMVLAHRFAYELLVGPIPEGLTIDHLCRNRACVNPAHLEAVTGKVNIRRGETGQNNARKTDCPRGHPYNGENLMVTLEGWRRCRMCQIETDRRRQPRRRAHKRETIVA